MKKYYRKIVRREKNKQRFSVYIPPSLIETLGFEDAMVRLEVKNDGIMIRKVIGSTVTTDSIQTSLLENKEKVKPYDYGDKRYY